MHTRKAPFRLPVVIICFAAVLGMAVACGGQDRNQDHQDVGDKTRKEKRTCLITPN